MKFLSNQMWLDLIRLELAEQIECTEQEIQDYLSTGKKTSNIFVEETRYGTTSYKKAILKDVSYEEIMISIELKKLHNSNIIKYCIVLLTVAITVPLAISFLASL